jgi:hypothetical protein
MVPRVNWKEVKSKRRRHPRITEKAGCRTLGLTTHVVDASLLESGGVLGLRTVLLLTQLLPKRSEQRQRAVLAIQSGNDSTCHKEDSLTDPSVQG